MRFRALTLSAFAAAAALWSTAALADHMTGRYVGVDETEGTVLEIVQTGRDLVGTFTGDETGTLTGRTDGGDFARGGIFLDGEGKLQFDLTWSPEGLTFLVTEGDRPVDEVFFAATNAEPAAPLAPLGPEAEAAVDEALRAVLADLAIELLPDGTAEAREALIACFFDAVAPLPVAERQFLVDVEFDPNNDEVERLDDLVPGIENDVGECFDAAEG